MGCCPLSPTGGVLDFYFTQSFLDVAKTENVIECQSSAAGWVFSHFIWINE